MRTSRFSINQVSVEPVIRLLERSPSKKFDEAGKFGASAIQQY
jgi:hypothetical protein